MDVRLWGIGMGQSRDQEVGSITFPLCIPTGYTCHTPFWEPRFGGRMEELA